MLKISVEDSGVRERFDGMKRSLSDLTQVWPQVHNVVTDLVKKNFDSHGGYTGQSWVPLKPAYAAWKARTSGKDMMHLTERLYQSLTVSGHGDRVAFYGRTYGEFGTSVPYARAHQYGRPEINLPARVVLPKFTKAEIGKIGDIILAFILKEARLMRRTM